MSNQDKQVDFDDVMRKLNAVPQEEELLPEIKIPRDSHDLDLNEFLPAEQDEEALAEQRKLEEEMERLVETPVNKLEHSITLFYGRSDTGNGGFHRDLKGVTQSGIGEDMNAVINELIHTLSHLTNKEIRLEDPSEG